MTDPATSEPSFGRIRRPADNSKRAPVWPIRTVDIELSLELPSLSQNMSGLERTRVLVRLHDQAVGLVDLPPLDGVGEPRVYAPVIWAALRERIGNHFSGDDMPAPTYLGAGGFPVSVQPRCRAETDLFRREAPFASVIIATRDRPAKLRTTLQCLRRLRYGAFEVVVVDNAPTSSATRELVATLQSVDDRFRYVREDRPGTAWARNRGAEVARSDYLAFTDDDVLIDQDWLTRMIQAFAVREDVACVTGLILAAELETQPQLWIEQFGGYSKGFDRRVFNLRSEPSPDPFFPYAAGKFGSGASMAFRRAALSEFGGFDPALGGGTPALGGEDIAAFLAILLRGHDLVYEPAAIVWHFHHRRYGDLRRQIYAYGVGLSAHIAKVVVEDPRRLVELASLARSGIGYLLKPASPKNRRKAANYPDELSRLELAGILYGPVAYLRGRLLARRMRRMPRAN